jgi:flagellar basal-body rod protein FlgF
MDVSSYVMLSHEQALQRRLDVTANNMANSSTAGFRREAPLFHDYVEHSASAPIEAAKDTSFVLDYGAVHDTTAGAFQPTGNPLDVMIEGDGYLAVEMPGGGTAYTRAGYVKVSETGDLVNAAGQRLLGDSGAAINVPIDQVASLSVAADGTVSGPGGTFGRIALTVFDDESRAVQRGDGLMTADNGRVLGAGETKFKAGGVEGSNVQPIVETTAMVEILRSYQSSQRITQSLDDMRSRAIEKLAKVN